jgi:hypothetical protein
MPGDVERARLVAALRIEGVEPVAGREPDMLAVERDAVDVRDFGEGPVFADDLCLMFSCLILAARQRA